MEGRSRRRDDPRRDGCAGKYAMCEHDHPRLAEYIRPRIGLRAGTLVKSGWLRALLLYTLPFSARPHLARSGASFLTAERSRQLIPFPYQYDLAM
jgi:hypothetical protein